jgi:hypothetical protein
MPDTNTTAPTPADIQTAITALNTAQAASIKFAIGPNPHIAWDSTAQKWAATAHVDRDEEFETTWDGGHSLIIEYGDCELYGRCQCGTRFGMVTPDKPLDRFAGPWERHVMGLHR